MLIRVFTSLILILLAASGCIEDNCSGVICNNDGVCVQGVCACLQGYEGEFCNDEWDEKFAGAWNVDEYDRRGNLLSRYMITTSPQSAPDSFYLLGQLPMVDTVFCSRQAFMTFAMGERVINDSTRFNGGEGLLDSISGNVTGVYSFTQNEVETIINFTWAR